MSGEVDCVPSASDPPAEMKVEPVKTNSGSGSEDKQAKSDATVEASHDIATPAIEEEKGVKDENCSPTQSNEKANLEKINDDDDDESIVKEDEVGKDPDEKKTSAFTREPRNRVKLYVLAEQRTWEDRGTGHVACLPSTDQPGFHCIIVRLEANEKNVLESKILMDTVYQKQQETLIVWSESESCDLALSFQEKSGCEEIWTRLCQVQGKDPRDAEGGDELDDGEVNDGASGSGGGGGAGGRAGAALPPPEMSRLTEIEHVLGNHMNTAMQRERMASSIESTSYVAKLCDVFRMCEDIENSEGLKSLYNIAKRLFMLNKSGVIDSLVADEHLKDVIGMLEYDPSLTSPKPHRDFLYEKARFRQILPMNNPKLKEKIHHTYRVQYLQDVCLPAPSLFEENLLSALNSHIFFTRHDIIQMLQEDKELLREMFSQLKDASISVARRRDLAIFLKELCAMSHQNGPQSKEPFYKTLIQNDVLAAVEECMRSPDRETRATTTEMLHMVVVFSAQTVRDFLLRQAKEKTDKNEEVLMNVLLSHIVTDCDTELSSATQMLQVMRMLLDPDSMATAQKGDKSEFLSLFYNRCIQSLVKTLEDNVEGGSPLRDDYHTARKQCLVLRLTNFCVTHHAYQMRHFLINNDLLNKVLVLLKSKHHFLALYALKLLRSVVQQKDDFYVRYVVGKKVFDKVVNCLIVNGNRNNLLNSAIIELFEFIRAEDMKALVKYVAESYLEMLSGHNYVRTFTALGLKYSMMKEKEKEALVDQYRGSLSYKQKIMDKEEQWFNEDEEEVPRKKKEEEKEKERDSPLVGRKTGQEPMFPKMKRDASMDEEDASVFSGGSAAPLVPAGPPQVAASPKILIKVDGVRSRSPSPGTVAREDEVSSSQPATASSTAAVAALPLKKALVEYDDSDSEGEEEGEEGAGKAGPSSADSLPSSSTGSPTPEESSPREKERETPEEEEHDDVSSTSADGDDERGSPPERRDSPSKQLPPTRNGRRKRREEEEEEEEPLENLNAKRPRVGGVDQVPPTSLAPEPRPSPPPVDPVAQ